ncbi:unnamed protein product [Ceutorhynchus assimilis]|uniref:Tubulin epsilon and delta complex protein 1 domain-containing protein n=1 Tax=Ceutorhynchus assimilis TaxID=467358 RepID=A0A9N9MMY2_9CUCU|nr:unnamed protein product [Ceutorhynchus assimilis]
MSLTTTKEIKNTIGLLCKLLNLIYDTNIKPEHFRLSKFNKTDENVVSILQNTLDKISKESNIQINFIDLNYTRKQFFNENPGSRELLLGLIFLVSHTIEWDLKKLLDQGLEIRHSSTATKVRAHEKFDLERLDEHDLKNYVMWLEGKILSDENMLVEYEEQIVKIQAKFNEKLDIKARNIGLTTYEILALKNKEIGEQFIQDTEPQVKILNIYLEWTKKEKQFWKWMVCISKLNNYLHTKIEKLQMF